MKVGVIRNKHAEDFRKICLLFIRLMSNVLKLFPFTMVMCSVVWFYFCPEHILSDIVNDWHDADTLEKYGLSDCI
ncbi:putative conjugative transfer protein [Escherichia coli]|nr:putative conjugative transfer protein [Escherichia coli]